MLGFRFLFFVAAFGLLNTFGLLNADDDRTYTRPKVRASDGSSPGAGGCTLPENVPNNVNIRFRGRGRTARYFCKVGYILIGKRFSTCLRGKWTSPPPICLSRGCSSWSTPANGRVMELHENAFLAYICNPGYNLVGSPSIYCDGTNWNASVPSCQVATTNPKIGCAFEELDLCGWSHDDTANFDWTRDVNDTPSGHVGTGPQYDHTYGKGFAGHYMYIEASAPRKKGDIARLFSPVYPAMLSDVCFSFWYHMFGNTTGSLKIYLKREPQVFAELDASWERTQNQGNRWIMGNLDVPLLSTPFQIVIEGIRGSDYMSDTAIDDVLLTPGSCRRLTTSQVEPDVSTTVSVTVSTADSAIVPIDVSTTELTTEAISTSSEQQATFTEVFTPEYSGIHSEAEANTTSPSQTEISIMSVGPIIENATSEVFQSSTPVATTIIQPKSAEPESSTEIQMTSASSEPTTVSNVPTPADTNTANTDCSVDPVRVNNTDLIINMTNCSSDSTPSQQSQVTMLPTQSRAILITNTTLAVTSQVTVIPPKSITTIITPATTTATLASKTTTITAPRTTKIYIRPTPVRITTIQRAKIRSTTMLPNRNVTQRRVTVTPIRRNITQQYPKTSKSYTTVSPRYPFRNTSIRIWNNNKTTTVPAIPVYSKKIYTTSPYPFTNKPIPTSTKKAIIISTTSTPISPSTITAVDSKTTPRSDKRKTTPNLGPTTDMDNSIDTMSGEDSSEEDYHHNDGREQIPNPKPINTIKAFKRREKPPRDDYKSENNVAVVATCSIMGVVAVILASSVVYFIHTRRRRLTQRSLSDDSEIRFLSNCEEVELNLPDQANESGYKVRYAFRK